jgi:ABC-type sulfate/molybdate transport systems ATPase subunit
MIRVTSLDVRVPGFTLQGASFTVPTGGVAVVTGPTGAGKTTLLETIAGVRPHHAGTIQLSETDVTTLPPELRAVGLVYQAAWLFPHLSVRDNITYGARREAMVREVLQVLPVDALLGRPLATLSGGERQLVALARALAREPQTLLLDEPFAAMDGALRASVRDTVLTRAATRGITTMLVTHDPAEALLPGAVQLRVLGGVVTTTG